MRGDLRDILPEDGEESLQLGRVIWGLFRRSSGGHGDLKGATKIR